MKLDVQIYDDLVPAGLREDVWKYLNKQKWYATWKNPKRYMTEYIPEQGNFMKASHRIMSTRMPTMWMHRACFASDDASLKRDHPIIWDLWAKINEGLGNQYTLTGNIEDMSYQPEDNPDWQPPPTADPALRQGWRVYAGGQLDESIKHSHGVHRDTVNLDDTTSRTILYVANLEWYPTWFAECIFYPDDEDNVAGDHQQYQQNFFSQARDFKVGWLDQGKIVSPIPGRIIDYDGRTLHTTRPSAIWANEIRKVIAFRARKT